jgi:transposase-like protein
MGRKPRVDRSPEEKRQIVQEGIKSGSVSEPCRRHGIAPSIFYRWKDEAEQGAKAALGGMATSALASAGKRLQPMIWLRTGSVLEYRRRAQSRVNFREVLGKNSLRTLNPRR